jgi:uncharacterized protein (DUF2235 family)
MPKNIIICSDGTGNTAVKDRGTNVFKLFEAIDLNGHRSNPKLDAQIAIYDDGVGTESFLPLKILGGAFGWGLKRSVLNLYKGLVRIYDEGDRIYLFGFSRGAFTVRTLAGLIARCGVLKWEDLDTTEAMNGTVKAAYDVYRQGYRTWLYRKFFLKSQEQVLEDAGVAMGKFRDKHPAYDAEIHFLGVWDTVDSVGGPFHIADLINTFVHCFKFPNQQLSPQVKYAVQALSIDEARSAFQPQLWEANPDVEQVWFSGVHSNIGGGYPKQGMSLVSLGWMIQKARGRGLRIFPDESKWYLERGNVDDKMYNSRAGVGVFYEWRPRDMELLTRKHKAETPARIHLSVLERIAHGTDGYSPGTLAPNVRVIHTHCADADEEKAARIRAKAAEAALNKALENRGDYLKQVWGTVVLGRFVYWCYVGSFAALIAAGVSIPWGDMWEWLAAGAAAGTLVATVAYFYVSRTRSVAFSRFWHQARHDLREALKAAKVQAQAELAKTAGTGQ